MNARARKRHFTGRRGMGLTSTQHPSCVLGPLGRLPMNALTARSAQSGSCALPIEGRHEPASGTAPSVRPGAGWRRGQAPLISLVGSASARPV